MKTKDTVTKIGHLLKETISEFIDDNGMKLSAALSYYTIFSLPPLLIIIISLCGFFFGAKAVRGEIFGQINGLVGNDIAMQIQETIKNVKLSSSNGFVTTFGIIIMFIGASGVFSEIQDSINYIWGIKAKPKRGLIKFMYNRLMSFSMIGAVGFLLLVSLINKFFNRYSKQKIAGILSSGHRLFILCFQPPCRFIIITLLFTFIFKTLPDGK